MSYRVTSLNSVDPDSNNNIDLDLGSISFLWRALTPNSVNVGSLQYGTGKNTPFYQRDIYINVTTATGVSVDRSSYFPLSATAINWFDEITLPQGDYEMRHNWSGSNNNQRTGKVAWVNNDTSARLGPITSFRDDHRSGASRFTFSASSGGLSIGLRILEADVAIMSYNGLRASSIIIIKR